MVINFQQISQMMASKLCWVAGWFESRTAQQSENVKCRNNAEKTRSNKIRLLTFFPESKPFFWEDLAHTKLKCFICNFLQQVSDKIITQMDGMTKRIKKGSKTHTVAFCCSACITGDPWIIHRQMEYSLTMLHIDMAGNKHQVLLMQRRKYMTLEGWLKHPEKVPYNRRKSVRRRR
jgi:hypothetical protein